VAKKKPLILVIDDQMTVIRAMERMLTDDYEVISALAGDSGIMMARDNLPDLILLDMVMPEMTGIEVCQRLGRDGLTQNIPVIFVSAMDDRHNEESGFKVKGFELEAQSVARSIIPTGSVGVSMVIDFGRTRTGITIALGQVPIFSTTVKIGGNALTEAIMEHYSVSEDDADEIKRQQGISECEDEELCKNLMDTTTALIDEIRRHYRYWDTRRDEDGNKIAGIERIFLCGGAVGLKGLPEHVSGVLQVPVRLGNVWGNMFNLNEHIPKVSRVISWQYATSTGLLLRDVM